MSTQLELFNRRRPKDIEAEVERMCNHLLTHGQWYTRQDLCLALGMDERTMRECVELSAGRIIFGQQGMKHIRRATPDEVKECINSLYSRARSQMDRAKEIERRYHEYGGKQEAMA